MSTSETAEAPTLSTECTVGKMPGYGYVHDMCRQIEDVPMPHGRGILLLARCRCTCHTQAADA
ncbi:hypothetical protein [Streptomyces sp. NBC_00280]|uniref:hypothetical protein n=1 Tax=Streptomyces sp. NBC_00280 TaxID=2975699 RepID=UPI0032489376